MVSIKKSVSHDRLSLTVKDGKSNIRLGWSRYRDSASSTTDVEAEDVKRALRAMSKIREMKHTDSLGVRMDKIVSRLNKSETISAAVDALDALSKNWE